MKRYGNLFEKIYNIENIRLAHRNARKGKNFYKEVKMVESCPDKYLGRIQFILKNHLYKTSEYTIMKREMNNEKINDFYSYIFIFYTLVAGTD